MASIPAWFDYETYMANKLAQMQKTDPAGNWTVSKLVDVFAQNGFLGEDGAYEHFVQFGANEDVAPNADFNASEYYAAKAAQFYGVEPSAVTELQIANVKAIIAENGMNAWTHYVQYGSDEGVNPSNAFDADAYLDAKTAALVAAGEKQPDGSEWTPEAVQKAISDAGMTVLEHYLQYAGTGEGEVAQGVTFPVPDDQKVPSNNPGETFTLTTGIDTFIGGDGDDIFNATESEGSSTLTALDKLDGGAGEDTLNIVQTAAVDTTIAGATVTSMEKVNITSGEAVKTDTTTWGTKALNITATGAVDATVADTTDVTATSGVSTTIKGGKAVSVTGGTGETKITGEGLTTVSVKGGGNTVTIDNTLDTVSSKGTTMTSVILDGVNADSAIKGQGLTDVTVKGATTAAHTVTIENGKADHALTVNVDGTGYDAAGTEKQTTVKDANATAITVNASGDKSSLDLTGSVEAKSLNITGDAALTLNASGLTKLTTIDGSAATGDLTLGTLNDATVNVNTGSGDDTFTIAATAKVAVDAGAGDDTVTLGAAIAAGSTINLGAGDDALLTDGGSVAASAVIDGGDGFDTVSAALINAGNAAQFHNFEALNLSSSSSPVTLDVDLLTHSTIEALTLSGGNQAATVSNVAAGVNLLVSGQNNVATTINVKDAATGTADAFSVAFNGTGDNTTHSASVVVNGIENLSVESAGMGSSIVNALTVTDDALQNLTITGDKALTLDFKSQTGAAEHGMTIDGSAATGALTIDTTNLITITDPAGLTVKTGSADDTITLNQKATVDAGAGNDTITVKTDAGNSIITTGAGDDTVNVSAITFGAKHVMTTITDFTVGSDSLTFADHGSEVIATEMTDVSSAHTLDEALNLAASGSGGSNALVTWFQYGGHTYIVEDMSDETTLNAADNVVKLSGLHDLSGQILHDAISFA